MSQEKTRHRGNPNNPPKRVRHKRPGPLGALIKKKLDERNWTFRLLEEHTREIAQATDPDDNGVSWSVSSSIVRGETQEPSVKNLWLMARAFGDVTLGDLIMAMGYDPSDLQTSPETAGRARVAALVRGATDDDLRRVERVLRLSEAEKTTLDVTLDVMQKRPAE